MLSVAIFKFTAMVPIMAVMALIIKRLKDAEEELLMQKTSWQEYELLRQAAIGATLIMLFFGVMICAL